ncbi:adventurous gliding motility protein AgmC [Corallococcus terminator]|uniref:Hemagglutinin n=1 Tax=Corallococcus terminator TaxID=2316733 RepID=A0A3A8I1P3_9BACT|nr:hypothetical protein [Corallococcus terminator]RKG77065.1 hypothetical protein D7V88_31475 [Corallococcus terminator]
MRIILALIVGLLLAPVARAEPDSFGLGTGRDGALTIVSGRSVVTGVAAPLRVAVTAGRSEVSVSGLGVVAGDLVMIHQTGGLLPVPTPGDAKTVVLPITTGPSRFELARVESVDATTGVLKLTQPLRFSYPVLRTQVLRVGEFSDVIVEAGARLSVTPWDGRSGGILAMLVSGTVINEGRIDADGAGFLGGVYQAHAGIKGCTGLDLTAAQGGSARGEGVAGTASGSKSVTGRGNLANGGGGGNCISAGGGGGGHGGIGGNGGRSSVADGARVEGGLGGAPLSYSVLDRFVFGGGGGAGEGTGTDGTSGGRGGGVVFIRALAFEGKGSFSASGLSADVAGSDGAGGGGAGGSVLLRAQEVLNCGAVEAYGGAGGDSKVTEQPLGPGGGGAGGRVLLQSKATLCALNVSAGNAGQSGFPGAGSNGAGPAGGIDAGTPDGGASTGGPSVGTVQELALSFQVPTAPVITLPVAGQVSTTTRPRIEGKAGTDGPVVHILIDGREVGMVVPGADGVFSLAPFAPLVAGDHEVTAWAEAVGVASLASTPVRFTTPTVVLADGGVVDMAVLVVPANGDTTSPTPLFAGTTTNGISVGVVIDDGPDNIVPADLLGRFRFQVPQEEALSVGVHKVTVHAHNEAGEDGPHSDVVGFEVVVAGDGGTGTDAGTVDPAVPMMVVPAQDASVDPTPTFVGVALAGTSVRLELDGVVLATVTSDAEGVFRHEVGSAGALATGTHRIVAQVVTAEGEAGLRSPEVGFQVRGPTDLDVGCGCGAGPAGMLSVWALVGLTALARRRARR